MAHKVSIDNPCRVCGQFPCICHNGKRRGNKRKERQTDRRNIKDQLRTVLKQ